MDYRSLPNLPHMLFAVAARQGERPCLWAKRDKAWHSLSWAELSRDVRRLAESDRPHVLREAIMCCRKGGTVSIHGVYVGFLDKIPFGAAMNKGLTLTMGQTHVQRYHEKLLQKIDAGTIDPSFVITHRLTLDDGPAAYKTFRDKQDGCIKVVLKP